MSSRSFRIGCSVTGLGLFATKPIKRGVYIATYRGRRNTTEEVDRREARGAKYQFEINKQWTIDGSPRWNVARYIIFSLIQIRLALQSALLFRRASSRSAALPLVRRLSE
jgi:hypothetical protein